MRWGKRGRWRPTTVRPGVTRTAACRSPWYPRPDRSSPRVPSVPGLAVDPPPSGGRVRRRRLRRRGRRRVSPRARGRVVTAPAGARATRRLSRCPDSRPARTLIGVVSDTHGLLRPEAVRRLRGVDRIVHAGDIGAPEVLRALEAIAPVTAVRGNHD